jgi:ubiquinone/menaquinone biosynthesis C-methylase UbiE
MGDSYGATAGFYDGVIEPLVTAIRQIGLTVCPPAEGMRLLDVGCGTGTNLKLYHDAGCQVSGIDLSAAMLAVAVDKLGDQAGFLLGDAARMPYADGVFDLVTAMLTLHEMPAAVRPAAISEMVRVTKAGGWVLLIDYHTGPLRLPGGWLNRLVIVCLEILAGRQHYRGYRSFQKSGGLRALIDAQRLNVVGTKIVAEGNIGLFLVRR